MAGECEVDPAGFRASTLVPSSQSRMHINATMQGLLAAVLMLRLINVHATFDFDHTHFDFKRAKPNQVSSV